MGVFHPFPKGRNRVYDKLHFYFGLREPQASVGVEDLQAEDLEACKRNNARCILSYTREIGLMLHQWKK